VTAGVESASTVRPEKRARLLHITIDRHPLNTLDLQAIRLLKETLSVERERRLTSSFMGPELGCHLRSI
jgi:hypothetical protein